MAPPVSLLSNGGFANAETLTALQTQLANSAPVALAKVPLPAGIDDVKLVIFAGGGTKDTALDWVKAHRSKGHSVCWMPMSPLTTEGMAASVGATKAIEAAVMSGTSGLIAGTAAAIAAKVSEGAINIDLLGPSGGLVAASMSGGMSPILILAIAAAGVFGFMWLMKQGKRPSYAAGDDYTRNGEDDDDEDDEIDNDDHDDVIDYDDDTVSDVDDSGYLGGDLTECNFTPNRSRRGKRRSKGGKGSKRGKRSRKGSKRARKHGGFGR